MLPLGISVVMSTFDTGKAGNAFIGLGNYVYLFTQPVVSARFWNALLNNTKYFAIHVLVEVPIGLLLAAMLTSGALRRSEGVYRTLLFIPATLSVVIVGFIGARSSIRCGASSASPCSATRSQRSPPSR